MDLLADDSLLDLRPRARRSAGPALAPAEQAAAPPPRPVAGTCNLCNARPARTTCPSCGRAVCSIDLWAMLGLCKACIAPKDTGRTP